jgi:prepilin-type N-terminal cleavage/methylation domain-containing protein
LQLTTFKNTKGFSLVELVVALAIFVIIIGGMAALIIGGHLSNFENEKRLQANAVLTETWEAIRAIRNGDWNDITNGSHGLTHSNGYWEFSGDSDEQNGITRQITVSGIWRDADGNILEGGGEMDTDSKKIQIQISWHPLEGQDQSFTLNTYLHNYQNPSPWPLPPENI